MNYSCRLICHITVPILPSLCLVPCLQTLPATRTSHTHTQNSNSDSLTINPSTFMMCFYPSYGEKEKWGLKKKKSPNTVITLKMKVENLKCIRGSRRLRHKDKILQGVCVWLGLGLTKMTPDEVITGVGGSWFNKDATRNSKTL